MTVLIWFHLKELEHNNYYCPDCKVQHELTPTILEEQNSVFKYVVNISCSLTLVFSKKISSPAFIICIVLLLIL